MEFNKEFSVNIINDLYKIENSFKSMCHERDIDLENLENLNERIEKLIIKKPDDEEIISVKKEVEKYAITVLEFDLKINKLKKGNETLFDWRILDELDLADFFNDIIKPDFKKRLKNKILKDEKIIYTTIDVNVIEEVLKLGEISLKSKILDKLKSQNMNNLYLLLNSPFNMKGKENATIYFRESAGEKEYIGGCSVTDVISSKLLSVSEEFDLEVLNNIKENNNLSKLYSLAYEEAINKKGVVNRNIFNDLERNINNIFIKKNLE